MYSVIKFPARKDAPRASICRDEGSSKTLARCCNIEHSHSDAVLVSHIEIVLALARARSNDSGHGEAIYAGELADDERVLLL